MSERFPPPTADSRLRDRVRRRIGRAVTGLREEVERLAALALLILVALVAGLTLGRSAARLEELPGLLLMVPAAIALRGNIFGALGSRLGTAIHAGTFRLSVRPSSVVGENLLASLVLTMVSSVTLAVLAKATAVAFGIASSITIAEFVVVSVVGGLLASALVLGTALGLAAGSVRFGWDPDNVTAPLVTAAGDVATIPALVIAAELVGNDVSVGIIAVASFAAIPVAAVWVARAGRRGLQTIIRESLPVLLIGIVLDLIAGVTVERQLVSFARFPALFVLLPAFLAIAGALGGTLSSRLSSQLHLGLIAPARTPEPRARREVASTLWIAAPVFAVCGLLAHVFARLADLATPGIGWLVASSLLAGIAATAMAALIAYYSTTTSVSVGRDPDTYGIPLVTSALDVVGAFALIIAVNLLGFV